MSLRWPPQYGVRSACSATSPDGLRRSSRWSRIETTSSEPSEGGEHLDVEAGDGAGGHRPRRRAGERVVRQQRPAVGGEPAPRPVEGTEGAEERTARQRRRGAGGGDVLEGRLELDLRAGR